MLSVLSVNQLDVQGNVMASKFGMGVIALVALGSTIPEPATDPGQRSKMTATRTAIVDLEACRDAWRKENPVPDEMLQLAELLRVQDREQEPGSVRAAGGELSKMTELEIAEKQADLLVAERELQGWSAVNEKEFIHSFRDSLKEICEERKIDLVLQKTPDPKVHEMFCGIALPDLSTHSVLYASEEVDITELVVERLKNSRESDSNTNLE